ncbi:MAG: hypothetical protein ACLR0U_16235 [Enterocloster clostridioformis]
MGAKLEKYFKKIVPDTLKLFFVPFLTVIIIVPLTFIVIGPVAGILTNLLNAFFQAIFAIPVLGGVVTGILIGALWQISGYLRSALGGYPDRNCQYQYIWKRLIHDSLLCGFARAVYGSCGYLY